MRASGSEAKLNGMHAIEAIRARRSAKVFRADRVVAPEEVEGLLELATLAPNHRMTQPWHFYVLGPRTKASYAALRGALKSRKVEDGEAARLVREKVERETAAVPCVIAVAVDQHEDPETREEDVAASWMGVENLLIGAQAIGLAGYIHTGRVLNLPELRRILDVPVSQRVIALIDLGEPAERATPKPRVAAGERTRWLD
ncbi:MAG: nitroreductase family protein [Longimicrobiales bacterium]